MDDQQTSKWSQGLCFNQLQKNNVIIQVCTFHFSHYSMTCVLNNQIKVYTVIKQKQ